VAGVTERGAGGGGDGLPRLYTELADWFHLLTAPADYAEDARLYLDLLTEAAGAPPRTLLELGSGGGNNASHYKQWVRGTLVDRSPRMLRLSRRLNPECEHLQGDMRSVRLGRTFDAVLVQDAVLYLTTEEDLRRAMATAFAHCRPGGVALFAPDYVRETFAPATTHGGHDGPGRALRYLAWIHDPDPADTTYAVDFAYLLQEEGRPTRSVHDRHVHGLFGRADWLRLLAEAGFRPAERPFAHSELPPGAVTVFVARKPDEQPERDASSDQVAR
jgi:SAM-dependent methyltransferase